MVHLGVLPSAIIPFILFQAAEASSPSQAAFDLTNGHRVASHLRQENTSYYPSRVQPPLPGAHELSLAQKREHVREAFDFAWQGYKSFAWGKDENRPVTNQPATSRNGWGASLVDGLDTLYLLGFHDEFEEAKKTIAHIDWSQSSDLVQVFETTIRYVGGLLSAYDLSGDDVFITKTVELVDRLLPAFDTPTGIPYQYVNFTSGKPVKSGFPEGASCLAEVGTVQMEFTRLSEITGDWHYHLVGQNVYRAFDELSMDAHPGLYPHLINADTGKPLGDYVTWGGMADSFYEYLIKQYVMSGSRDEQKKQMVIDAVRSVEKHLLARPQHRPDVAFLGNLNNGELAPVMEELACFAPGNLLLAARTIPELAGTEDWVFDLMHGCYNAWAMTRTGLAPELFGWVDDQGRSGADMTQRREQLAHQYGSYPIVSSYILRPETLESIFYFYRFTRDRRYQDMAWEIFNSIHTYCRANSGFSGVHDVDTFYPRWDDRQESFLYAETLKYLYMIFEEPGQEQIDLETWVLNTEAHPFRIVPHPPLHPPKPAPPPASWFGSVWFLFVEWFKFLFVPYLQCFEQ
ncbi:glycoside hydrolase [Syncephalastrum racemosum]|uniref:alpha-1,2-Mannosidase n=1 Tax=Syncephalastrum racemosum TaxID=13706 RepID=A0A1X2H6G5_SYNRA|nr:glycoside hydrolase [Syncephalastrum racemosum]